MPQTRKTTWMFIWRIASAHLIAYFIAGVFALFVMDYKTLYASDSLSMLMRPVDSPWVALGPGLQVFRGILLALVLLPIRNLIFGKYGYLKLMWLILGLCSLSTIGPTPGSFDGFIYTLLPVKYHLAGIPETLLYILLFTGIIALWYKSGKKYLTMVFLILSVLILVLSIRGTVYALQLQNS